MAKALIGKKIGMTQIFTSEGQVVPVTVLQAGPCVVTQKKTVETDGYNAVQLGFEKELKDKKVSKPQAGHFKKAGVDAQRFLKEFRVENIADFNVGQELDAQVFAEGDIVDIQGVSLGRGFQGVMKRHGFAGGPESHGSHFHRAPGSVGMCEFPGETPKGRKMPGQMGNKNVTIQCLEVVKVMPEKNILLVKGSVPGHKNGVVYIKETVKPKK